MSDETSEPDAAASPTASAAPGWYPNGPWSQLRWWNGTRWTRHTSSPGFSPPPPPKRWSVGRVIGITIAVVFGIPFSIGIGQAIVQATMGSHAATIAQPPITDRADGCARFIDFMVQGMDGHWNDDVAKAHARGLRDAARGVDDFLASDMNDLLNADNAAEVSAGDGIVLRRCDAGGYISDVQRQRVHDAATKAAK